jgi:hypothetical protein
VIIDRDGEWPNLRARRPAIYKRAMRAYRRRREHAAEALHDLLATR